MINQLLTDIYQEYNSLESRKRRNILIEEMSNLDKAGKTCANCVGNCCTFTSNSMRITPLEAVEMLIFLDKENRINSDLINNLENCIRDFRLDAAFDFGIKKNYTCPFYLGSCQGCSISRAHKPYGCLAFNANEEGVKKGVNCSSNQDLLEQREETFPEEKSINAFISKKLKLTWEKLPIPVALLDIIKKGELSSP